MQRLLKFVMRFVRSAMKRSAGSFRPGKASDDRKTRAGITLTDSFKRLTGHRLPIDHIISLGAGTGGDSIAIRDRFYQEATLLMVEAQADHEPALAELCRRSVKGTSYEICAATREDGTVEFNNSSLSGGVIANKKASGTPPYNTITVPARSVDSLVQEYNLDGNCFLKFDTHGVEVEILEGAIETLKHTALIMMEVYNFKLNVGDHRCLTFDEMCGFLRQRGFRTIDICAPLFRPSDGALWQAHLFFIRADHPIFNSNSYSAPAPCYD